MKMLKMTMRMGKHGYSNWILFQKGINQSLSIDECQKSGTDYIDIRLGEVMLNYAEAAVEVGKLDEAFDMLKQIRKRAGIKETSSNPDMKGMLYGLNPKMSQEEMREAVHEERFIELLFEQKRLWDMRRWMIYDKLMTGQEKRHALVMTKKEMEVIPPICSTATTPP